MKNIYDQVVWPLILVTLVLLTYTLGVSVTKEKAYKKGVSDGINMTVFMANQGITKLPTEKMVEEAWRNTNGNTDNKAE